VTRQIDNERLSLHADLGGNVPDGSGRLDSWTVVLTQVRVSESESFYVLIGVFILRFNLMLSSTVRFKPSFCHRKDCAINGYI
jgi:hypothetical protein